MSSKVLERPFFELLMMANSILFVRMAPSQKSMVIDLAKNELKKRIMAIGDGYNDTQMLEAADCGIRIRKRESNQFSNVDKGEV